MVGVAQADQSCLETARYFCQHCKQLRVISTCARVILGYILSDAVLKTDVSVLVEIYVVCLVKSLRNHKHLPVFSGGRLRYSELEQYDYRNVPLPVVHGPSCCTRLRGHSSRTTRTNGIVTAGKP